MSKIAVSPNGSGTGTYTLASPNNNASHTITLPVATGELLVNTATGVDVTGTVTMDGGSTSGNFTFGDNDKAIFGAGSDLQIYHDGSNSYIVDAGTGLFQLRTNGSRIEMVGQSGSEYMARFEQDGAVKLYYDNALKLATTSTGIDVTGTVTATAYTGDGSALTGVGATAWGSVNQSTNSINASSNISSVTDNGVGDTSFNFSSALTDGNYAFPAGVAGSTHNEREMPTGKQNTAQTSSLVRMRAIDPGSSNSDHQQFTVAVFR